MTFQLEDWSKTEDVVQTFLQVRSLSSIIVALGLGGTFTSKNISESWEPGSVFALINRAVILFHTGGMHSLDLYCC